MQPVINIAESGLVPNKLLRLGIRYVINRRLKKISADAPDLSTKKTREFVEELKSAPLTTAADKTIAQHYEMLPRFFELCLGQRLKYSCAYWPPGVKNLNQAEISMLDLYLERGEFQDGMDILELGCGWGSVTLYLAQKFPNSKIVGVSNSVSQRQFIESECKKLNLRNVEIITADMNQFSMESKFDRIVSIEMFEYMRNYEELLSRISNWLKDNGKLFVHLSSHRCVPYFFDFRDNESWMGRYFFSDGIMPSHQLLMYFQKHLKLEKDWVIDGVHYQRTVEEWLKNMESRQNEILEVFKAYYPQEEAAAWYHRWKIFYMARAELFGYRKGKEWWVSHYLFSK